jgi:epoxyqueuosine reductase
MVYLNSSSVKKLAISAGFDKCGISRPVVTNSDISFFNNWLDLGYNADMKYMSANKDFRYDPTKLMENSKSVISVILNYNIPETLKNKTFNISKYALINDYHEIMRNRLERLLFGIKEEMPQINVRIFTDTAPILERYFAMSSGLGFIGKNTCLINPDLGSWVFIGELLTDAESDFYDSPIPINCGECNKCINACPCHAINENGLNANKCISYHTIENKNETPKNIADKITNQLFGCDICQNVCPYNNIKAGLKESDLLGITEILDTLSPIELQNISNREFNRRYKNTSLIRAGRKKIIENFSHLKNC